MSNDFSSRPSPPNGLPPTKRSMRSLIIAAASVLALVLVASCVVTVDETEDVLIERLGEIVAVYDRPDDRGLHFKLPWPVETTRRFDRRIQYFSPPGREVLTRDKKNVIVGAYVCWKIAESQPSESTTLGERPVVRFYRGLGGSEIAEARLESRLRSILGTQMGQVELGSLLAVADSSNGPAESAPRLEEVAAEIERELSVPDADGRSLSDRLGIEIVDVGIRQFQLPAGNQQAVFERMRSERRKIADGYRSAGMAENRMIMSQADRQAEEILARARADAERIRGEGEAEALAVLNRAHARDPEFYRVSRTLDAYRAILNDKTTLVLSADNPLLKLLTDGIPESPAVPAKPVPSPGNEPETTTATPPNDFPAASVAERTTDPSASSTDRKDAASAAPVTP